MPSKHTRKITMSCKSHYESVKSMLQHPFRYTSGIWHLCLPGVRRGGGIWSLLSILFYFSHKLRLAHLALWINSWEEGIVGSNAYLMPCRRHQTYDGVFEWLFGLGRGNLNTNFTKKLKCLEGDIEALIGLVHLWHGITRNWVSKQGFWLAYC